MSKPSAAAMRAAREIHASPKAVLLHEWTARVIDAEYADLVAAAEAVIDADGPGCWKDLEEALAKLEAPDA